MLWKVKSSSNFIFGPQQPFSGICQFRPTQLDSSWYIKTKFNTAVISPQLGWSARPSWLGLLLCYCMMYLTCLFIFTYKFSIRKIQNREVFFLLSIDALLVDIDCYSSLLLRGSNLMVAAVAATTSVESIILFFN